MCIIRFKKNEFLKKRESQEKGQGEQVPLSFLSVLEDAA